MNKKKIKDLVYIALYSALFVLFDYISNQIPLFEMSSGGKLNLGTIVLLLASYQLGYKKGIYVCLASILLMLVVGSASFSYGILSFILDYFLGYVVYGISVLFPNYKLFFSGIIITSVLRIGFSTISGCVVFETNFIPSLVYQLTYIVPTMIVDIIVVPLLYNRLGKVGK